MKAILLLIEKGEGETVDFKQTISSSRKIAKTIVSFANTKGGKILVGVKDNGVILGTHSEEEKYMLEHAAQVYCKPPITLLYDEDTIEGKELLIATVPESHDKPHYCKDDDDKWWAYIRVKDKCLLASKVMLDVMRSDTRQINPEIKFGEAEKRLLKYLENNEKITIKEFCKLANISRWRANKILVNLVRMRIVKVLSHEKQDYYSL
jgi:predicted HTH transcriptional regulator